MSATAPSWYDVLGVDRGADEAEIRSAWRTAIADLDPTDRRFRAANQAAEVLLDPDRRAEYDATLPADEGEPEQAPEEEPTPAAAPAVAPAGAPTAAPADADGRSARGRGREVSLLLLAALAVLTAAVLGTAAYLSTTPSDTAVAESTQAAQSAAERAIVPILSYDHRSLDEDQAAARAYLTPDYRPKYDQLFEVLRENAPRTETVVEAEVVESGIVRSGVDRVEVLLFVNRPTTNKQQREPVIYKDAVRVQLEKVDGDWLVDCLITTPGATCE